MSKNIAEIPYTEIQERVRALARIEDNAREKARGVIQDVYTREIPSKFDWNFMYASSSITSIKEHRTGTASIDTGTNLITFSADAAITTDMTERKIKFSGNDVVYTFATSQSSTSDGTVSPPFEGPSNLSSVSYSLFQPRYALAEDFDRFPQTVDDDAQGGGLYRWQGGKKVGIPEESYIESVELSQASPSIPKRIRIVEENTAGEPQIEMRPPPRDTRVYNYDYLKQLKPLGETSAGTVTITAGGTAVTGSIGCRFSEANTGDWIRINAFGKGGDSEWHRILAIAHDSAATLKTSFGTSGATTAEYVISKAPEYPVRLHPGVIFGAIRALTLDQTDENFQVYDFKLAEVLSDAKRIHTTRVYSKNITGVHEDFLWRR